MNKQYYIKLTGLLLGLLLAICTACKKPDATAPQVPGNNPPTVKLIQYGGDTSHILFGYNGAGNINKVDYVTNGLHLPYDIIYANGAPVQMVTPNSNTNLTFNNGLLQKTDLYNNNGKDLQNSTVYNYINDRLSGYVSYQQEFAGLQQVFKYVYDYLPNGDIGFVSVFLWDVNTNQYKLLWTFKCDYDDHPNPIQAVNNFYIQFYAIPASPHNITQLTVFDSHNAVWLTATYVYKYDQNGYPTAAERTSIQPGAAPSVYHVKYSYQ